MFLDYVAKCETRVIAMDQMQNLKHALIGPQAVSEALKNIMDAAPGTMLTGAGIELDTFGVFTEGYRDKDAHLAQTGSRFSLHHMRAYDINEEQSREDWLRLLNTLEKSLLLFKAQPRDLVNNALYLHEATGGLAGEILPLLRNAANHAIAANTERITLDLLERLHKPALRDAEGTSRSLSATQPIRKSRKPRETRAKSPISTTPAVAL
jgi:nucleoid DNA-binding protein